MNQTWDTHLQLVSGDIDRLIKSRKWNTRVVMSDTEPDMAGMADALPDVEPHGTHREMG